MDFNNYQEQARTFRAATASAQYALLGLAEESGEVLGKIAKYTRDGGNLDDLRLTLQKELGDVLWMVAAISDDYGIQLQDVAVHNIRKLEDRKARNVIHGSGDIR